MALKRPRAAYEADLQKLQSPYVFFGTPLPPLDDNVRDDGSYVPVWKQEVVDERGRKRLHGAFTGGFSAGYFNTVGSKEGWTPAAFVSSRTNRAKPGGDQQQRLDDLMDDEDRADAEEARQLETSDKFAGFGLTEQEIGAKGRFMDLFRPADETMGMKLLRRMGWRDGQGIGPQVRLRRKTRSHEPDDPGGGTEEEETYLAPPKNTKLISLIRKTDTKGLGYEGDQGLDPISTSTGEAETGTPVKKPVVKPRKGGIGIGVLNDTGSDDEDPYDMGPKLSYGRTLGGEKRKKKKLGDTTKAVSSPNPLLKKAPVFTSKKASGFRKCHDGRLPLDGFVLSTQGPMSDDKKFPIPVIPEGWVSSRQKKDNAATSSEYQSTADLAKASTLNPSSRASMLGETVLPGKSVFDFLTPSARDKLVAASNNTNLPPARSEALPSTPKPDTTSAPGSDIPALDPQTASNALNRGTGGFVPYLDDPAKQARYRAFLAYRADAGQSGSATAPVCPPGTKREDFLNELHEFAHAALIFKPMTGAMASRFTSSSTTAGAGNGSAQDEEERERAKLKGGDNSSASALLTTPSLKPEEEAAKNGMFGPLTRTVEPFYPSRLLCKRFGVPPPTHVLPEGMENGGGNGSHNGINNAKEQSDPAAIAAADAFLAGLATRFASGGVQIDGEPKDLIAKPEKGKRDLDSLRRSAGLPELGQVVKRKDRDVPQVDPSRNEALEIERPSEETFRSIFADDDDD